jgi:hypothetical protein
LFYLIKSFLTFFIPIKSNINKKIAENLNQSIETIYIDDMSSEDTNVIDCKIDKKKEIKTNKTQRNLPKSWSKEEKLNLVFIAINYGEEAFVSKDLKLYFSNRSKHSLIIAYKRLKENANKYQRLKNQVKIMKNLIELNRRDNNNPRCSSSIKIKTENKSPKSKVVSKKNNSNNSWTHEECLYLIYGVQTNGENWENILKLYSDHFDESKTPKNLKQKYLTLQNDVPAFKFYSSEVNSLLK